MPELKEFLNRYDTIIFDMDGVITSEQAYWDTAALTVYELLNSENFFGTYKLDLKAAYKNVKTIRKSIFFDDEIVSVLKNKGVNSNWDIAYIVFCASIILNSKNADKICKYCSELSNNILDEYDRIAISTAYSLNKPTDYCVRYGELWTMVVDIFQCWYFGDGERLPLMKKETPLFKVSETKKLLETLSKTKKLGFGTGRPFNEIAIPLRRWRVMKYFDTSLRVTYDEVEKAEKILSAKGINKTLSKPHPYVFLQAALGKKYNAKKIIKGIFDKSIISKTLIVGDAGADMFAAQAAGFDFCAVLTGINGVDSKRYFEKNKATYILNSVMDFLED